jgi:hypothetical protein
MGEEGKNVAYIFYADKFYLDRANRDTYLIRNAAGDIELSGSIVLASGKTVDGTDISAHVADLDAHVKSYWELLRTGEYTSPTLVGTGATVTLTANTMYAMPFLVARAITIDRLAIDVATADAGKSVRLGIYNNGTNLYPGTLLKDYGAVSVAETGVVAASGDQALTKGLYWLALVSDGVPTLEAFYMAWSPLGQNATDFTLSNQYGEWYVAFTYAALPDPFTAGGNLSAQGFSLLPRIKSLD